MTEAQPRKRNRTPLLLLLLIVVVGGATAAFLLFALDRGPEDGSGGIPDTSVATTETAETTVDEIETEPPVTSELSPAPKTGYNIGNRAPDFALSSLDGQTVTLSSYRGQVVILDFWASWCIPCRNSMPSLYDLWKDHETDGVIFLGVSLDRSEGDAVAYIESKSYPGFLPLYGSYAAASRVASQYGVSGIPRTFVIDREGIIRFADHPATLTAAALATWI